MTSVSKSGTPSVTCIGLCISRNESMVLFPEGDSMNKFVIIFACLFSLCAFADVSVVHTSLRASAIKGKDNQTRVRIALCENGRCSSLVKSQGYTASEWQSISKMCKRSEAFAPLGNMLKLASNVAGVVLKGHPGTIVSFILGTFGTSKEELEAIKAANKRMSHIMNVKANTSLTVREFYHVMEGIKSCSAKLEDYYRHLEMGKRVMYR